MATFHKAYNNGVYAVYTAAGYLNFMRTTRLGRNLGAAGPIIGGFEPVFTFVPDPEGLDDERGMNRACLATGTYSDMKDLLEGHEIVDHDQSLFVPFSNAAEYVEVHGKDAQNSELRWITGIGQARETFGKPNWIPKVFR